MTTSVYIAKGKPVTFELQNGADPRETRVVLPLADGTSLTLIFPDPDAGVAASQVLMAGSIGQRLLLQSLHHEAANERKADQRRPS